MNGVGVDAFSEVGADRAGGGLLRVRGTHELTVLENGAFAFENLDHDRAGRHEGDEILEEGTFLVNSVEAFGFSLGKLTHLGGDDLEAVRFETGVDLADDVLGNGVRLDDGEGAFNSHFVLSEKMPGKGSGTWKNRQKGAVVLPFVLN